MTATPQTTVPTPAIVRFGPFTFDFQQQELTRGDTVVPLEPQPSSVLALLLQEHGEIVSRKKIQLHVWGDRAVAAEDGINYCIRKVRLALGDNAESPSYLRTIPRRGYRFEAHVHSDVAKGQPADFGAWSTIKGAAIVAMVSVMAIAGVWIAMAPDPVSRPTSRSHEIAHRVVVLPFEVLGGQTKADHLGVGIRDALTTSLARLNPDRLEVISPDSASRYRDRSAPLQSLAEDLGVDFVVRGNVLVSDEQIKVGVRLVATDGGRVQWANSYNVREQDALRFLSEIPDGVAGALNVNLLKPGEMPTPSFPSNVAREPYLRGRYLHQKGTAEGVQQAIAALKKTTQLAPEFAPGHAALSRAIFDGPGLSNDKMPAARDSARRALELDPGNVEARLVLADVTLFYEWDWTKAEALYYEALALAPGLARSHKSLAFYLTSQGKTEQALESVDRALELDPVSVRLAGDAGFFAYRARRFDLAARYCSEALRLDPDDVRPHRCLAQALDSAGRTDEALNYARHVMTRSGAAGDWTAALDQSQSATAAMGHYWDWTLANVQREWEAGQTDPWRVAVAHARVGDAAEALDWLERSLSERSGFMPLTAAEPAFDALRADPRFRSILESLQVPTRRAGLDSP